ncbi:magnesium transporter [Hydrocarboniclastica marina]|uniref:Magnesium transporter MgtE n=1 Tax=Hydrocarboniclastica marina TaxID=2259620 RepID=A0A4P7XKW0_9ALTE|nr:magnesium transporter [Hydrocarboniclastica marina]MAL97982.1 magnesium transporter [Alteromonadaceae bacterium]QCF26577.1 magnesium transporter [Hydrocarboniclastica marina]
MASLAETKTFRQRLRSLSEALDSGSLQQVARILNGGLSPSDIAHLLESSPPRQRTLLWSLVDKELEGEVLQYLSDDIRSYFLSQLDPQEVASVIESFEPDDLADLLQQLPEAVIQEVLETMDEQDRQRVEAVLAYPEDTAGGLMNTDTVTVRPDLSIEVILRYLRRHRALPAITDSLFVVNRKDDFIGVLPLTTLLVANPAATVREVMHTDLDPIPVTLGDNEVANLFERHDLISAPVVSDSGKLLGRITIDDVVDVIREDAAHSLMGMAGLDEEEDTFAPILKTTRRRAVWLGINLITAFIASAVIGLFEHTIEQVVALAVLMPIVASMGGIAGSQALTLVIRGMAVGQISPQNIGWLLNRELIVGALNGLAWALVVAVAAVFWFNDLTIGLVIAAALVINLVAAAVAGTTLPLILKARKIDPALAGGVILTTITDVIGFASFLGLATLAYS